LPAIPAKVRVHKVEAQEISSEYHVSCSRRSSQWFLCVDPACGSGNFLVIAYKEMRAIEAEINRRRNEEDRRTGIPLTPISQMDSLINAMR
jgi:hypothetical protein